MRKYIFISLGGVLGAISRYVIKNIHLTNYKEQIPVNTLFINITGSFLLALILTIAFEVWEIDSDLRLGIATGFLGAYTTFSTLCKETVTLFNQGFYYSSISYIGFSAILGLFFVYFGVTLAKEAVPRLLKNSLAGITEKAIVSDMEAADDDGGIE